MDRRKLLENTIDTITKICNRCDEIYKVIPDGADKSAIYTLLNNSFGKLSVKMSEYNVVIATAADKNNPDISYIAYIDSGNESDMHSVVTIMSHDFSTGKTSMCDFSEKLIDKNSSDYVISELIKDVSPDDSMYLIAYYNTLTDNTPTLLTKTSVTISGIIAALSTFVKEHVDSFGSSVIIGGDADILSSVSKTGDYTCTSDYMHTIIGRFHEIFSSVVTLSTLEDMDEFLAINEVDPDSVIMSSRNGVGFVVNDDKFELNEIIIEYHDDKTNADVIVNAISFKHKD